MSSSKAQQATKESAHFHLHQNNHACNIFSSRFTSPRVTKIRAYLVWCVLVVPPLGCQSPVITWTRPSGHNRCIALSIPSIYVVVPALVSPLPGLLRLEHIRVSSSKALSAAKESPQLHLQPFDAACSKVPCKCALK